MRYVPYIFKTFLIRFQKIVKKPSIFEIIECLAEAALSCARYVQERLKRLTKIQAVRAEKIGIHKMKEIFFLTFGENPIFYSSFNTYYGFILFTSLKNYWQLAYHISTILSMYIKKRKNFEFVSSSFYNLISVRPEFSLH